MKFIIGILLGLFLSISSVKADVGTPLSLTYTTTGVNLFTGDCFLDGLCILSTSPSTTIGSTATLQIFDSTGSTATGASYSFVIAQTPTASCYTGWPFNGVHFSRGITVVSAGTTTINAMFTKSSR